MGQGEWGVQRTKSMPQLVDHLLQRTSPLATPPWGTPHASDSPRAGTAAGVST